MTEPRVIHFAYFDESGALSCCGKRPAEVPEIDGLTLRKSLATCNHVHSAACHPSADGCPDRPGM